VSSDSVNELAFSNGSRIRVGTSFRGGTYQYIHVSEFGKICAASAEKAREIVTGALNAVDSGQYVFIESTAEGGSGHFFHMCQTARLLAQGNKKLSCEEYRFFFFPWYKEPRYALPKENFMGYAAYFSTLLEKGIELSDEQKSWYARKADLLREDMFREYPSFPEEAFFRSLAGAYYEREIERVRREGRIKSELYDAELPVHTAWDLGGAGGGDETAIWFFQQQGGEIHLIDYLEASGYSMTEYIEMLSKKPYEYGEHFAPHDIRVHEYTS